MTDHLESSIFGEHEDHPDALPGGHHDAGTDRSPAAAAETERGSRRGRRSSRRSGRAAGSGGPRRSRPSLWRRLLVIVLALAVVGGGVTVAVVVLRPVVEGFLESNDFPGPGEGEVSVTVAPGSGGSAIADLLVARGVVKTSKAFNEAAAADEKSSGIQPGVYKLKEAMKASDALAVLVDPANRVITRVVIPEGLWATEIYAKLSQQTGIPVAKYVAAAKDGAALGLPSSAKGNVEGYLFPASYEFEPGSSAPDQLQQMVAQSTKRLSALGITPDKMERVVILASLVEGEAQTAADRGKVARVVENRLARDTPLGFDSTVNYIFKKRGVPTQAMLNSASPYNTRKVKGLPPGPIANPGENAIKAAAAPPAGDWFWFTTVNLCTGETKFAVSDADNAKNVAQFRAWYQATDGKC
ncbi:aminodeoxychorismate lyase [Humibacillus sp. DSM 29435]|uniref:endolytic transglycosylase MltG n=1 Tax=Humibacillus sp. DSM 29435 TaxID=1869167 RepID=UPI0008730EB3|nr:endolytic transglycosylase MltG [Humibacillus sp. DSM 29435]OFE17745.1 aminodeoxychorismate lyase [Humibacillus sp. DSM 29435]